jgi:hypothetical protein
MDQKSHDTSEYMRSRLRPSTSDAGAAPAYSSAPAMPGHVGSVLQSPVIGASYNASVRAAAMASLQGTHGNRAVQRQVAGGAGSRQVSIQRNPMEWMWETFGNAGDVNNMVDAGSSAVDAVTSANAAKNIGGWSDVWQAAKNADKLKGGGQLLPHVVDAAELAQVNKAAGVVGTGANIVGVGMGINNFINAKDNYERVQAGADTTASAIGFLGPLGSAFSGGYSVGQLLNKTFGLSDKLSDVLVDLDPLGLQGPSIEEMSDDELRELSTNPIMHSVVRKEQHERGAIAARMRNRHRDAMDAQKTKEFEKEMEALSAQIERGPAIPSTMLGGPGDALSARNMYGQQPQVDEDGEPVPYVPMALPGR